MQDIEELKNTKTSIIDAGEKPKTSVQLNAGATTNIYQYEVPEDGTIICSFTMFSLTETSSQIIEAEIKKNNIVYGWDSTKDLLGNATHRMSNASAVMQVKKGDIIKFESFTATAGTYYYSYGYTLLK